MEPISHNRERLGRWASFAGEALCEALWPTRCVLCDRPGSVLCDDCRAALPYCDQWRACPRCGSPFGLVQCDLCNPVMLGRIGRTDLPFAGCASALLFDDRAGHVVRQFKDGGEQRLARVMGELMARAMPLAWDADAVTFVPASKAALSRRGFDHGRLLGQAVADALGLPCVDALERPQARDQRTLSARGRIRNQGRGLQAKGGASLPGSLLLVDDVLTTGATLCAASDALAQAGAALVRCLTFARA